MADCYSKTAEPLPTGTPAYLTNEGLVTAVPNGDSIGTVLVTTK
jgi:hypothetical protein